MTKHTLSVPAPGDRVELVCLRDSFDVIRSRLPPNGPVVVVRTGISEVRPVPGEIFAVEVERSWVFGHTRYVKGVVTEARLDLPRLGLEPLRLDDCGVWDPEEEPWQFEEDQDPLSDAIRAAGPRPQYEMEQVLPEVVELHWEEDPILEAAELATAGAWHEAADLLGDLLTADLRCLDAHAHLGLFAFQRTWPDALELAERHYRIGIAIGELSLSGPVLDFPGLLPWGLIDNRPFLRCLHGLGLTLWRKGDLDTAGRIFERLAWLAPQDGLGARFLVNEVRAGKAWEETR